VLLTFFFPCYYWHVLLQQNQYSLTLALEDLGFPTLHTQHLYENDEIFEMWTEQVFRPSYIAKERTMGTPDIDMIAKSGYQGTMDLPMALYYEQVLEEYPDCKFILTVRESSEIWFKSWDTLLKSITQPARYARNILPFMNRFGLYFRWLSAVVNTDDSYFTTGWPLPDQQKAPSIASYEAHNARVREVIPSKQLLEYSVKEGWEPLCNFLEIEDCPTVPFPKSNSARSVQVQSVSAMLLPLVIVLFVLFYGVAMFVKKTTGKTVLGWANMKCVQLQHSLMGSPPPVRKAFKSA